MQVSNMKSKTAYNLMMLHHCCRCSAAGRYVMIYPSYPTNATRYGKPPTHLPICIFSWIKLRYFVRCADLKFKKFLYCYYGPNYNVVMVPEF